MKISPINHFRGYSKQNVNQNFKGLWGRGTNEHYEDSTIYYDSYTNFYYPFKNEPQSSIDEVVLKHTKHSSTCPDPRVVYEPITTDYHECVIVRDRLPFTEGDYKRYKNNPDSTAKRHIIEKNIVEHDLEEDLHYV